MLSEIEALAMKMLCVLPSNRLTAKQAIESVDRLILPVMLTWRYSYPGTRIYPGLQKK